MMTSATMSTHSRGTPSFRHGGERPLASQPRSACSLQRFPLGKNGFVNLAQFRGSWTDPIGDRLQLFEVEPIELSLILSQNLRSFVHRYVPEPILEKLASVRPGALRMRKVVSPHDVAYSDFVTATELATSGIR